MYFQCNHENGLNPKAGGVVQVCSECGEEVLVAVASEVLMSDPNERKNPTEMEVTDDRDQV